MKKLFRILAVIIFILSLILLIFGFGENGFAILHECSFWVVINAFWTLVILLLLIDRNL